ncbi:MAG: CopD family protein, partial [Oligoflexus sp.]
MIEWYRPILAFHVIAIISWMAGILYLYRLLIYAAENRQDHAKVEELLKIMSRRLLKAITIPAM